MYLYFLAFAKICHILCVLAGLHLFKLASATMNDSSSDPWQEALGHISLQWLLALASRPPEHFLSILSLILIDFCIPSSLLSRCMATKAILWRLATSQYPQWKTGAFSLPDNPSSNLVKYPLPPCGHS